MQAEFVALEPGRRSGAAGRRRDAILAAATEVFLSKGFEAATLEDVIALSKGSRSTLYALFGNKEGLFTAVVEQFCRVLMGRLTAVRLDAVPDIALREFGRAYVGLVLDDQSPALFRVVCGQGRRDSLVGATVFRSGPQAAAAHLSGYLSAQAAAGRLHIDDCERAAHAFLQMVQGHLFVRALLEPRLRPSEAEIAGCVDAAVSIFLGGLGGR